MKRVLILTLSLLMLLTSVGCVKPSGGDTPNNTEAPQATDEPVVTEAPAGEEYVITDAYLKEAKKAEGNARVFYEIFVGSFSDSDGDGVGDLRGIINRMDYLNDGDPASGKSLGIDGIWLTPIFESPSYHKYDVTDYYKVDPAFGTEADLKELIDLCHERGVYVILDLVINHTGRKNEWYTKFREAHQQGDTQSEYYDFYTWYDADTQDPEAGHTYGQILGTQHFYECNFSGDMPELNFDNPLVIQAVTDVAEYYIDLGVDGFRFDAAKYVYYGDHQKSLEFWDSYLTVLRQKKPDLYTVAEVWDGDGITDIYYQATDCFDFYISQAEGLIAATAKKGDVNKLTSYIASYLNKIEGIREGANIIPFISNHDMDRAAGYLTVASGFMQMAANLYILGPGSPFIYYGEELGMRGSRGGSNTDANRRLRMRWDDGDTIADPTGAAYPEDNRVEVGAKGQLPDEHSLYNYYKKLIMARKANPEIYLGTYEPLKLSVNKVGGFRAEYNGSAVYVIHNTTGSTVTIDLSELGLSAAVLRAVIGMEDAKIEGTSIVIGGQTSVIIK